MSNILTAQSKGKLKESGVQTAVTLMATIVGAFTGQAIGRTGFLASMPVIFAGEYFDQPYVTAVGAGMASSLTAPSSVNGMDGLDGTKLFNLKAAETRVKNHAKALQRAVFLGEVEPTGESYTYYLSDNDMGKSVGTIENQYQQLEARETMSKISPFIEELGEALAEYDDFLDGYEDIDLMETFGKIRHNLEGISEAVMNNPELMGIDDGLDEETMEQIDAVIGMLHGASMQGLSGDDEEFIENISYEIGALEGLLGMEDDEDDDDELNGSDDDDEFDSNLNGSDEFSESSILFGLNDYEDDEDDIMDGLF
ncbi:hypothetical protein [Bernardetia sp. MNP-M8]|uniref:hypothetical protein n=1 Tax=Bernardetia sp. MNP-M8 TaxID=3127470 RepID=UPI0030CF0244